LARIGTRGIDVEKALAESQRVAGAAQRPQGLQ
jgi:hypothetical protein